MKKAVIYLLLTIGVLSCSQKDEILPNEPIDYLVSEVRDYNDRLIAKYFYNDNKQLIRREFTNPITKFSSDLFFEYEDDLVKVIKYVDNNSPQFSHNKHYYYSPNRKIIKINIRTTQNTKINTLWTLNYFEGVNQISLAISGKEPGTYFSIVSSNVVRTTHLLKDLRTGEESHQSLHYKYDDKKRPNFGLDYLVGTHLLPFIGTTSGWERTLSKNNLIEEETRGVKYTMEYNAKGYPISITTKKAEIETFEPQVLKITYR